jgi:predicted Zn-dependent protease
MAAAVVTTAPLDAATRTAVLQRIERDGADTYLPAMLAAGDSALHRWGDDRMARPVRVAVLRDVAPGFHEVFFENVGWAITRWNAVGLPIYLEQVVDTAGADIVVTWADRLDSNRAGRADVAWERSGRLFHVTVTLATHTPDGRQISPPEMVALALHELGHALGLGHSPVAADALHPETSAKDLTARDRRTVLLLYALPPGSLK